MSNNQVNPDNLKIIPRSFRQMLFFCKAKSYSLTNSDGQHQGNSIMNMRKPLFSDWYQM